MAGQGDVKKIMEDAEALQPTFFVAVPRVLERLMGGIKTKVAKQGWVTQVLFRWGFHQKLSAIHQGRPLAEVWLTDSHLRAFARRCISQFFSLASRRL